MASTGTWKEIGEATLTRQSLEALLRNEIPAIRIRNFATAAECAGFAKAVEDTDYKFYSVAKKVGYIGLAQIEYRWNRPKADYFKDAAVAYEQLNDLQNRSFDVINRLMETLQAVAGGTVKIAEEAELGRYYAGIARIAAEGVDLHADWAPLNSPTYDIARIDGQLGWNFYAQELIEGGDTTVYNAPWTPDCAPGEIPKSYGLDYAIVEGAKTFTFNPNTADVVIFNTRNPHEIAAGVAGPGRNRISIGSFVGRMPNNDLVLWS
ncbi:hypothetical protein [Reyranella sp. CPCC 100927]|uniref:2OG-Fe(II)-dependent halogenase WelO5 family protein n=1 Tax=Reyranella sp. CPCC 100927 TaxID=2599616 RepID=UPI0011B3CFFF|nr:hypothetical protein [Reyranella sp. CPCC 100927]TWT02847.1 hypothetical protein FQU96_29545 [Reyranella sp. CPCC 100927]